MYRKKPSGSAILRTILEKIVRIFETHSPTNFRKFPRFVSFNGNYPLSIKDLQRHIVCHRPRNRINS